MPYETQFFLNSFHPLCKNEVGRNICKNNNIAPFVDYSIRREPDFEHNFPSVTGLCRCDKLIGQAEENDFIAYVTVKSAGPRRLVAILQVLHKLKNHSEGADWYHRNRLPLPRNCVVLDNDALPLSLAVPPSNFTTYKKWCLGYIWRARHYPTFLVCRAVCGPALRNPPFVPENIFERPFPNTRSPKRISKKEFTMLRQLFR
ncbi:MAG TPA: hypothetical protein VK815_11985 [Candidatus Acidoferrales bacterium]|jgi:hypothetical protein|nr:hypothetical protein [Candidatus Acidoferrales bacterium]